MSHLTPPGARLERAAPRRSAPRRSAPRRSAARRAVAPGAGVAGLVLAVLLTACGGTTDEVADDTATDTTTETTVTDDADTEVTDDEAGAAADDDPELDDDGPTEDPVAETDPQDPTEEATDDTSPRTGGGTEDQASDGTPVVRSETDFVGVGTRSRALGVGLGVTDVDPDRGASLQLNAGDEGYGGWHDVGDVVLVDRYEVEVLGVDEDAVDLVVRELETRPDRPLTVTLPGGSREFAAAGVRVQVSGPDGGDRLRVRVATADDQLDEHARIGETVSLLDHEVDLLDRQGDVVTIEVRGPDGTRLPEPGDGAAAPALG